MPVLLDLFLTFLKIGTFSFGGGYGMIPLVTDEVVSHGWLSQSDIMNYIAVSESTPGPIAVNMATFVGASQAGFIGSLLATIGVVLPAFIIMLLIVSLIKGLLRFNGVKGFLFGVRPVVVALICGTGLLMLSGVLFSYQKIGDTFSFDYKSLIVFAVICLIAFLYKKLLKKKISPIVIIIISAFLGIIFFGIL